MTRTTALAAEHDRLTRELGRLALVADGLQAERDALRATVARVRDQARSERDAIHRDLTEILHALGISDHARPYSSHEVVRREVLPAIREDGATVARVRDLHRPFNIYDECDHDHTDEDVAAGRAMDIRDVGYTCRDALLYVACIECCTDRGYQTEDCATHHDHTDRTCSTVAALAPGEGT